MDYKALAQEMLRYMAQMKRPHHEDPSSISRGEAGILIYLTKVKDGALSGDLSKSLDISTGRIAIILKALESKGYIRRQNDIHDKRRVKVFISEEGRKFAKEKDMKFLHDMENILSELGEKDAPELVRIIKRIMEIVR